MPHQFLHHLQLGLRRSKQCGMGSAEGVSANALCDSQPLRCRVDVVT